MVQVSYMQYGHAWSYKCAHALDSYTRRGPVVRRSLWTRPARVRSPGWEARIIRCKNLALYIGDCESLVTG